MWRVQIDFAGTTITLPPADEDSCYRIIDVLRRGYMHEHGVVVSLQEVT